MFLTAYLLFPSPGKTPCAIKMAFLTQGAKVPVASLTPKMCMVEKRTSSPKFSSDLHMHACTHIQ